MSLWVFYEESVYSVNLSTAYRKNKYQSHQQRVNKCENNGVYGISWHLSACWSIDPCLGESESQLWTPLVGIILVWRANSHFPHDVHRRMRMPQYVKICLGYSKNCSPTTLLSLGLCKDLSLLSTLLNQTFCHKLEVGRLHILSVHCHLMWG